MIAEHKNPQKFITFGDSKIQKDITKVSRTTNAAYTS